MSMSSIDYAIKKYEDGEITKDNVITIVFTQLQTAKLIPLGTKEEQKETIKKCKNFLKRELTTTKFIH